MTAPEQVGLDGVERAPVDDAPSLVARINAIAVKVAFPFIAKDDIRHYLCGINIRPLDGGGVIVVASDGLRFVVMRDSEGWAEKELVVTVLRDATKHCNNKSTFDVLSNGKVSVCDETAMPTFIQPGVGIIDGVFPRIENAIDAAGYKQGLLGAFNPAYLADALEIGEYFKALRFFSREEAGAPLLFVLDGIGGIECVGGIARMNDACVTLPDWLPRRGVMTTLADA